MNILEQPIAVSSGKPAPAVFQNKQYILTADIHYQFHKITCGK
jgi:hypothetical protein